MVRYKIRSRRARAESPNRIAATEAAKNLGRLVNRVREERATYVIERGGTAVAQIGPVDTRTCTMRDFVAFLSEAPRADEEYLRAVEKGVALFNKPKVPHNPWER